MISAVQLNSYPLPYLKGTEKTEIWNDLSFMIVNIALKDSKVAQNEEDGLHT